MKALGLPREGILSTPMVGDFGDIGNKGLFSESTWQQASEPLCRQTAASE